MFEMLWTERVCSVGMFLFFGGSIGIWIFLTVQYHTFIREAENMSVTKKKELKAIKTKFCNSYGGQSTEEGVSTYDKINVEVFVNKAVSRLKICGKKLHTWKFLSRQCLLISIMFAGVGCLHGILDKRSVREVSIFYVLVFLMLYVYFSVCSICDLEGQQKLLSLTMIEYLENHMLHRLHTAKVFFEEEKKMEARAKEAENSNLFAEEKALELERLLEEFFV